MKIKIAVATGINDLGENKWFAFAGSDMSPKACEHHAKEELANQCQVDQVINMTWVEVETQQDSAAQILNPTLKDVHTEHCCTTHGCKYGANDFCSVVQKLGPQNYCEECYFEKHPRDF